MEGNVGEIAKLGETNTDLVASLNRANAQMAEQIAQLQFQLAIVPGTPSSPLATSGSTQNGSQQTQPKTTENKHKKKGG
jgi:hypothetical protein